MIGRELSQYTGYVLDRASEELAVDAPRSGLMYSLASTYIRVFGVPEVGAHVRISAALAAIPRNASAILDIGCGPGMLLGGLERLPWHPKLTGIEIDRNAATIASLAHPRATVLQGDFLQTEFPSKAFDCATMVDVLEHVPDAIVPEFMTRVHSLLRIGGTFVVHVPATEQRRHFRRFNDWEHHDHEREGFTAEQLTSLLRAAGFNSVSTRGTFGYWGSLGWEVNMAVAGSPLQAAAFPFSLSVAALDRVFRSKKYNGVLAVAVRS